MVKGVGPLNTHGWVQGEGSRRLSRQRCFIILTALHLCENFTLDRVLQMQISKSILIYGRN